MDGFPGSRRCCRCVFERKSTHRCRKSFSLENIVNLTARYKKGDEKARKEQDETGKEETSTEKKEETSKDDEAEKEEDKKMTKG